MKKLTEGGQTACEEANKDMRKQLVIKKLVKRIKRGDYS